MPRFTQKTLSFPLAGVSRSRVYRAQTRPYATPWAVNVRGVGSLERRLRGGSRPGLARVNDTVFENITAIVPVTHIDADGDRHRDLIVIADGAFYTLRGEAVSSLEARLKWDDGTAVLWDDEGESNIIFNSTASAANPVGNSDAFDAVDRYGKLFVADAVLSEYDPLTGVLAPVAASVGTVPAGCPLVTLYRDRLFLSGADHVWYASRQGDPTDWHFGADMGDPGRAVAGHAAPAGKIGDVVQAMIPIGDSALLFATRTDLWMLRGDPADGNMVRVIDGVGVLTSTAWAMAPDGAIAFLGSDGIYVMAAGSTQSPARFSEERIPDRLRNIDPDGKTITMAYDIRGRGFHLFISDDDGDDNWWIDLENRALWPVQVPATMQPVAATRLQGQSGLSEVIMGCRDGLLRKFDADAQDDDGTIIDSAVLIGPFRLTSDDLTDAMLAELHGIMADNDHYVDWQVVMGDSAEEAADAAVYAVESDLIGRDYPSYPRGHWIKGRNLTDRPRARGPWAVIWLSSVSTWAYEAIGVKIAQLGRFRYGR